MANARFEQRARLSNRAEFQYVFESPSKSVDLYFTVLTRPNDLGFSRLGLVISRKSATTAVVRNRIKRIVRESFRHHQHPLGGRDCVVIGRTKLADYNNAILYESLKKHWSRLIQQCEKS